MYLNSTFMKEELLDFYCSVIQYFTQFNTADLEI
jgi:hypothetical protein